MLPEFHSNPLSGLILSAIESVINYENMTFPYFLEVMQIFSAKSDKKERIRFVFKALDINHNGRISKTELLQIYSVLFGGNITEGKAVSEVQKVLSRYDRENKGFLNIKDFVRFYNSEGDMDDILVIDFERNIEKQKCGIFWFW
jgi:Ca2+-binding EF-hand superfamily protein